MSVPLYVNIVGLYKLRANPLDANIPIARGLQGMLVTLINIQNTTLH